MVASLPADTVRVDNVSESPRCFEIYGPVGRIDMPGKSTLAVQASITHALGFTALKIRGKRCVAQDEAIRIGEFETGDDIRHIGRYRLANPDASG